jgi:hypothetical protein
MLLLKNKQSIRGATGETGATGATGADGFSPTATVTKSGRVATISITDKNGTTTADVYDGQGGGATYTAGQNISISAQNVISAGIEVIEILCMLMDKR